MWFMSNKKTFCIPLPFFPVLIAPQQAPKARNCFCSDEYCCCKHIQPAGKSEKANLWSGTDPFESNLFLLLPDFVKIVFHLSPKTWSFRPSAAIQLIHVGIDGLVFNGTHPFERGWKSFRWFFAREMENPNDRPIIRWWRSIRSSWVLWRSSMTSFPFLGCCQEGCLPTCSFAVLSLK